MGQAMNMKAILVINADDFGKDDLVDQTILSNLCSGRVTSASIMPNGESFQKACEMVQTKNIANRIGVHLTLDEGVPLSEKMKGFTNIRGEMCLKRKLFINNRDLLAAVYCELRAQIEHVIKHGIIPSHLDSHRHFHVVFPISRIVIALAKEFGIPYVRIARNVACNYDIPARLYKLLFNIYLASRIRTTDHFTDLFDFYEGFKDRCVIRGTIECMCHLDASERGVRDQALLRSLPFEQFISNYELISYAMLSKYETL